AIFAIDGVGGREQLAGRFPPQHIAARRRLEQIGRVRLPTLELADRERTLEVVEARREISFEPRHLEGERRGDVLGAGEPTLTIHPSSVAARLSRAMVNLPPSPARPPGTRCRPGRSRPASGCGRPPDKRAPAPP